MLIREECKPSAERDPKVIEALNAEFDAYGKSASRFANASTTTTGEEEPADTILSDTAGISTSEKPEAPTYACHPKAVDHGRGTKSAETMAGTVDEGGTGTRDAMGSHLAAEPGGGAG